MTTKLFAAIFLTAFSVSAQTSRLVDTPAATNTEAINPPPSAIARAEQVRAECLQGRRMVCGRILKVLPDGLVVESGYTDLLRPPVNHSWLVSGSVTTSRPGNQVEGREPEAVCVGVVFLTDIPKGRRATARPKPLDYVILLGYPAGQYTYTSVGTVQKTVRRFSANLLTAVKWNVDAAEKQTPAATPK
jgi:hypothetical protein